MRSSLAVVCVAYDPDWEPLADSLKFVLQANGETEQQGKADICNAVADRKIEVQVTIDRNDMFFPGRTFWGKDVDVSRSRNPTDFDWTTSRPLKRWRVGPTGATPADQISNNITGWDQHHISLIELRKSDVRKVLCSARISSDLHNRPTNTRNAGRKPTKLEQVKAAMRRDIKERKYTPTALSKMLQKELAANYGASRETVCKARDQILSEINFRH